MLIVILACALLVVATSFLHYEVLRALNVSLPNLGIPNRTKLLVVIITAFITHAVEMVMYGAAFYILVAWLDAGGLNSVAGFSMATCMYLSAESYTSLGLGDITPLGPVRLVAAVEALNGLLLIGWSASFTYISMERFWSDGAASK